MPKIKLAVWDLDNTLWNGTVFYKDRDSISLKPGTKETLKELDKRGIKNSICSKNYFKDAEKMLETFGIMKYFQHPHIGWDLKSESIKKIAKLFNLDYSEILFIDDDPFQRAEVSAQIPNIHVAEISDPIDILNFEGIQPENLTEVDKERVTLLKQQRDREVAEKEYKGDYRDFLKDCRISMVVRDVKEEDWPRIAQLLNRTNELNATGNRYKLEELKESYEINNDEIFVVELKDKFGEYGIIAEAIINVTPGDWFIRDLTVSCRTMGRGIGSALLTSVLEMAKKKGIKKVRGYINNTESNWRMKPLFEKRGFTKISQTSNIINYEFDMEDSIPHYPDWIEIKNYKS